MRWETGKKVERERESEREKFQNGKCKGRCDKGKGRLGGEERRRKE